MLKKHERMKSRNVRISKDVWGLNLVIFFGIYDLASPGRKVALNLTIYSTRNQIKGNRTLIFRVKA